MLVGPGFKASAQPGTEYHGACDHSSYLAAGVLIQFFSSCTT
jgi:hypothetical protein